MRKLMIIVAAALLPTLALADEAVQQIEEVVVTGAVRGNDAVKVADIDLPADKTLPAMPVAYE